MENSNIKILNKVFDRHFWNQIKVVNSYEELPKVFRANGMMKRDAFDSYSKMGQFFSIKTKYNHYLVLLHHNGKISAMDTNVYEVSKSEIENDLMIVYLGLELEDVLNYFTTRKITESEINRLVKKILK